jgi:hypothetical protein
VGDGPKEKGGRLNRFYHSTTEAVAATILREGFRDGTGKYLTDKRHRGVWVSNVPLDQNDGTKDADALLELQTEMAESDLEKYEWVEEGRTYREWLIPASIINKKMSVRRGVADTKLRREPTSK